MQITDPYVNLEISSIATVTYSALPSIKSFHNEIFILKPLKLHVFFSTFKYLINYKLFVEEILSLRSSQESKYC
jgi:hypothetical protein